MNKLKSDSRDLLILMKYRKFGRPGEWEGVLWNAVIWVWQSCFMYELTEIVVICTILTHDQAS